MTNNSDMNYEKLEQLLLSKSYRQLTKKEQRQALQEAGNEEEYELLRKGLLKVRHAVLSDSPGLNPEPSISLRLISAMQLHPMKEQVVRNSFADFFIALLSPANLGLKTAVAMLVMAGSFWLGQHQRESKDVLISDSTQQFVDTSFYNRDDSSFVSTVLFIH